MTHDAALDAVLARNHPGQVQTVCYECTRAVEVARPIIEAEIADMISAAEEMR